MTGLLLRYVDDFLLITRESEVAKQFLNVLQRGIPEYNCHFNEDKTATNFKVLPDGSVKLDDSGKCHSSWILSSQTKMLNA